MKQIWNELMEKSVVFRILVYLGIGALLCGCINLCDYIIPWDNYRYDFLIILIVFCTAMILRKIGKIEKK